MAPALLVDLGLRAAGHAGVGIAPGPAITAAGHEAHFERYPLHAEAVAIIFHFTEPIRGRRDACGFRRLIGEAPTKR